MTRVIHGYLLIEALRIELLHLQYLFSLMKRRLDTRTKNAALDITWRVARGWFGNV
jgi:hypothetical protein